MIRTQQEEEKIIVVSYCIRKQNNGEVKRIVRSNELKTEIMTNNEDRNDDTNNDRSSEASPGRITLGCRPDTASSSRDTATGRGSGSWLGARHSHTMWASQDYLEKRHENKKYESCILVMQIMLRERETETERETE